MKAFLSTFLVLLSVATCLSQKMTDRGFDGYKGKVKFVEMWDEDVGPDGRVARKEEPKADLDRTYDESGTLVGETAFFAGERRTYFILDGDRVSKSERFENDPRVKLHMLGTIGDRNVKPKSIDKRYNTKYKYEYDKNGRIIEERQYKNDGSLWSQDKFEYDANGYRAKEVRYIEGKIRYKETNEYDVNGNQIGELYLDYDGNGKEDTSNSRYTNYKLDKSGNWIERTRTLNYTDDGKKVENVTIEHRNISYY